MKPRVTVGRKPRVAVSQCLLGEEVRYDGGHKRSRSVTDVLGEYFEWVPVCPEVEVGMGIPREPIRLLGDSHGARLVGVNSGRDWSEQMAAYAEAKVSELAKLNIDGFVLKKGSPSCGMENVEQYDATGRSTRNGVGAFARVLMERLPPLPVEQEDRLDDASLRDSFITRVYAHQRRRTLDLTQG